MHWVDRGTGTPKDRDEVNNREVCECDGWVCDWEVIDVPSRLRLIRKVGTCVGLLWINKVKTKDKMYMSVGVMKDYKLFLFIMNQQSEN